MQSNVWETHVRARVCVFYCTDKPAHAGRCHMSGPCTSELLYFLLSTAFCVRLCGPSPEITLLFRRIPSHRVHVVMFHSAASATSNATVT